jgi:integrase
MGLYKRGHVWWMRFTYRGQRIRKSAETTDKKLAERIYHKILGEIAEGKWFERLPGEDKTFREMMERFESEYFSNLASFRACKSYVKGLVAFFEGYTLSEITPSLINEFKIKRKAEGVKPATIHRQFDIMKRAFNIAIREWEWCKTNPVTRVSLERPNNKRDRWLTLEEENRLLQTCPQWFKEIIIFALNTGVRLGEGLSLTWKGVDLFRKTVTIFKSKNNERRTIPLNETVFEMLKAKSKVRSIRTDLVFHSKVHTPLTNRNIERAFHAALRKANIEDFRFHDLRHTFATRLVQSGVDLYKVQILLGHKTSIMTQRYAHHSPESLRDGVAVLDKIGTNLAHLEGKEKSHRDNSLKSLNKGG